jgi:tetratricopeptide (TPR) repeat protein
MPSNVDVILAFAWATWSLKGVFQPKKINAAMIKISANNRITFESNRKRGAKAIVKSLKVEGAVATALCAVCERVSKLRRPTGAWLQQLRDASIGPAAICDIETLYRTTIVRNPACWMAYVNLGNILYKANRIPEAMDLFSQASRIKPAVAHYSLGDALIDKGRTSEAIEEYRQALRIYPDYAEAYNNLGNASLFTGRTSEAIDQYEQALRINPDYAEAHNNLGSALRINPGYIDARNNLAKLEALQKSAPAKIDSLKP